VPGDHSDDRHGFFTILNNVLTVGRLARGKKRAGRPQPQSGGLPEKAGGGAKNGTAANIATIYNCLIFIDVFRELSKHTLYTKGSYGAFLTCGQEEKINYK
jgi:hypothetical protein